MTDPRIRLAALAAVSLLTLALIVGIFFGNLEDTGPAWGLAGSGLTAIAAVLALGTAPKS